MPRQLTRSLGRLALAVTLAAVAMLQMGSTPVNAAISWTCEYRASDHRMRLTASGAGTLVIGRDGFRIMVNAKWCDKKASVTNTDQITVLAGAGNQVVQFQFGFSGDSGFVPGFTNEPGNSDEIEISVSLGGGHDKLSIVGAETADHIVLGASSGGFAMGRANLNAGEATGVDADLTMVIGIEEVEVIGGNGGDTISGAGGAATGEKVAFPLTVYGGNNSDLLTGGAAGDYLQGSYGSDTIQGGPGPDHIHATDGVDGNDTIQGGKGVDFCDTDAGDSESSCES